MHTSSEFVADRDRGALRPRARSAGRLVVIPLGVPELGDEARMPAALDTAIGGFPFVLAIATLEPRKNLPHLVSAVRHPRRPRIRDLRLVIAGS